MTKPLFTVIPNSFRDLYNLIDIEGVLSKFRLTQVFFELVSAYKDVEINHLR